MLGLDFFRYTAERRHLIRERLRFKAEHNLRRVGASAGPVAAGVPGTDRAP